MNWDTKWPAVSAIAGVAAIVLPLVLLFISRDTKELIVQTVSHSVLVDLSNPLLSSLKLTYKEVPVDRLTVATIEFRNTGTRPIEREDFERPINLRFQNPVEVLAVTLSDKTPSDLSPMITSDTSGVSLAPLLLNPGDRFRITIQLRGDFNEPTVEARISGIPSISRKIYEDLNLSRRGYLQFFSGIAISLAYVYLSAFISTAILRRRSFTTLPSQFALLVLTMLGIGGAGLYVAGARTLELSEDLYLSWPIVGIFSLVALVVVHPLARRNAVRLDQLSNP